MKSTTETDDPDIELLAPNTLGVRHWSRRLDVKGEKGSWHEMTSDRCTCLGEDCLAAIETLREAQLIVRLVDEAHFIVSILRCVRCGQHFLSMFGERIDWADGEDPQTWVATPVSEDEVRRLQAANVEANEDVLLEIVPKDRRLLYHDMPKGKEATLAWRTRPLLIPRHD